MSKPDSSPLSAMMKEDGARGACPAFAIFQTCYNCPFMSPCPYKVKMGDYSESEMQVDQAVLQTLNTLIAALSDETQEEETRRVAVDILLEQLSTQEYPDNVRAQAVLAIGEFGDIRAYDLLCDTVLNSRLKEKYAELREDAALCLGELGDTRAVGLLCQLLEDWHPGIRFASTVALGKLGDPSAVPQLQIMKNIGLGDDLGRVNDQVKEITIFTLALLGDTGSRIPLETMLTNDDRLTLTRAEIIYALGELGDPASLPALLDFWNLEISDGLRRYTAISLGKLGHEAVKPFLINMLQVTEGDFDIHAARALVALGDASGVEVLALRGLTSRMGFLRRLSAQALRQLNTPKAHQLLSAYVEHEPVKSIAEAILEQ